MRRARLTLGVDTRSARLERLCIRSYYLHSHCQSRLTSRILSVNPIRVHRNRGQNISPGPGVLSNRSNSPKHRGANAMLVADTMAIFLVVLGFMLALPGLWLLCRGLWPRRVNYAALTCGKSLYKPFLAGLPVTLTALILVSASKSMPGPVGTIWSGAIICLYLMQASVGVAGLATCIGE